MTPIFVYRRDDGVFYCRDIELTKIPKNWALKASIDAGFWLTAFLNYDAENRRRIIRELEEK